MTTKQEYFEYSVIRDWLREKLNASPEEIAAWVFIGPDQGGLAAYTNVNELTDPPRFYFSQGDGFDYLSPLQHCWFLRKDLELFKPRYRFITGGNLVERWQAFGGNDVEEYIQGKISEGRLTMPFHPVFGDTRWTNSDEEYPGKGSRQ